MGGNIPDCVFVLVFCVLHHYSDVAVLLWSSHRSHCQAPWLIDRSHQYSAVNQAPFLASTCARRAIMIETCTNLRLFLKHVLTAPECLHAKRQYPCTNVLPGFGAATTLYACATDEFHNLRSSNNHFAATTEWSAALGATYLELKIGRAHV